MNDYIDKETRKFLIILFFIVVFLVFVFPRISSSLVTFNGKGLSLNSILSFINNKPSTQNKISIDTTRVYTATVNTNVGSFNIDLYTKGAPINVSSFVNHSTSYSNKPAVVTKDFLFKVNTSDTSFTPTKDEINADYLGLNKIKVKDAPYLKDLYDPSDSTTNAFSSSNLDKYQDFTLKDFYSTVIGYKYDASLITQKANKYTVYMTNKGPDQNGIDFFVILSNYAPQVDGRFTPIGQISTGFDVIDKINNSTTTNTSITINSISISSK